MNEQLSLFDIPDPWQPDDVPLPEYDDRQLAAIIEGWQKNI